jgi:hypothetical protein
MHIRPREERFALNTFNLFLFSFWRGALFLLRWLSVVFTREEEGHYAYQIRE